MNYQPKQFQSPTTKRVAKVAACISLLQNNLKHIRKENECAEANLDANSQFDDQTIMIGEQQQKLTPQKSTQITIPSHQTYPVKSLGQRPLIRLIQKSKQIIRINQMFRPAKIGLLNESLSTQVAADQQTLNQSSLAYNIYSDKDDTQQSNTQSQGGKSMHLSQFLIDSPREKKSNRIKTVPSFGVQNHSNNKDTSAKLDWGYSIKTELDDAISKEQQQDQGGLKRPSQSASGRIYRQPFKQYQSEEKIQLSEERKNAYTSMFSIGEHSDDKKSDARIVLKGRQIKGLMTQQSGINDSQFSIQNNNFLTQEATITKKGLSGGGGEILPQFGNVPQNQYSTRTRSCEIRTKQLNKSSITVADQIKSQSQAIQSSQIQNHNSSQYSLYQNETEQIPANQQTEEQQDKAKTNNLLRLILKQIHKNDEPEQQQHNQSMTQGEIFENKDKFLNYQDGSFFKQVKNSQKLLKRLQNKSVDSINQMKQQLQNIQIQGQSLTHRLGAPNIEKIIKTLKQQKDRSQKHPPNLKGSYVFSQKQEERSQNPLFQCWNDHSDQNMTQSAIIHINGLNKNPKTQVKDCEVQRLFQNQSSSSKRQCQKQMSVLDEPVDPLISPEFNKESSINLQNFEFKENQTSPKILNGISLNPNSNHINFRKYGKKEHVTKPNQSKENNSKLEPHQFDQNKHCGGWEQTSAFSQTAESLFLEFVQTNLKKRQNLLNIIKYGK